jgi:hypothetical protein
MGTSGWGAVVMLVSFDTGVLLQTAFVGPFSTVQD